ncbi:MAG TPA: hypothetical protein VHA78_01880 [Candidatus Peribacteraceae bacterium]|nr:hypothetical protein [Candidatus Peribacteraceae bacterium]
MGSPDERRLPDLPSEPSLKKSKKSLHRRLIRAITRNVFHEEVLGLIDSFQHTDLSISLEEHYVPDTEEAAHEHSYDEWEYADEDIGTPVFSIKTTYKIQFPTYANDLIHVSQALVECTVDPRWTAETISKLREAHRIVLADFLVANYVTEERPYLMDEDEEEDAGDALDYEDRLALLQKEKDIEGLVSAHRAIIAGTFDIIAPQRDFHRIGLLKKEFPQELSDSKNSKRKRKRRKK